MGSYPLWMLDVLEQLEREPEFVFRIECLGEQDARSVQLWWAGFKKAGLANAQHTLRYPLARSTTTRLVKEDGKAFLDIMLIDEAPDIKRWGQNITSIKRKL